MGNGMMFLRGVGGQSGPREEPDITAKAVLDQLCSDHPERFRDTHLRTLRPGVKRWRGVMAWKPEYVGQDQSVTTLGPTPEPGPVGTENTLGISVTFSL